MVSCTSCCGSINPWTRYTRVLHAYLCGACVRCGEKTLHRWTQDRWTSPIILCTRMCVFCASRMCMLCFVDCFAVD